MERIKGIDGLRALAVLSVLMAHYLPSSWHAGHLIPWNRWGVPLFFVISGFLITNILLRVRGAENRGAALRAFYWRRALRIFPPYYACLIAMLIVGVAFPDGTLWSCLTYTYNFHAILRNDHVPYLGHFWTLCVEEQFYLLWPALLFALVRVPAWIFTTTLIVIGCASRAILSLAGASGLMVGQGTITNLDNLGAGALLACFGAKLHEVPRVGFIIVGGLAFSLEVALSQFGWGNVVAAQAPFLMALGCACVVAWVAISPSSPLVRILELYPIAGVGRISYGLYLYHFLPLPILYKVVSMTRTESYFANPLIFTSAMLVSVWVVAIASWFILERPLLRLKDHFDYPNSGNAMSATEDCAKRGGQSIK